jgi:Na+-transporting NADH:ubiquinone oxidoreductase subunit B
MLRKFLDFQLALTDKGKPLHRFRPLISALDTFLYEPLERTKKGPHIRDVIDIKRWMVMVVIALLPAIFWGIWNAGLQDFVYSSGNYKLMDEYLVSNHSFSEYFSFALKEGRFFTILNHGLSIFIPLTLVVYLVGGFWEAFFACVRGHEISEGFLVSGILIVLILPPTMPLWMVVVGVSAGIIFAKELFGGSGMNIVNPALACRAFLFFTFPGRMTGNIWVGSNPTTVRESLIAMNQQAAKSSLDGYTQATALARYNISPEIKRMHIEAIASNDAQSSASVLSTLQHYLDKWNGLSNHQAVLGSLSQEEMHAFVTSKVSEGGLGLLPGSYEDAVQFASLQYGLGSNGNGNFFFGDMLGCIGETSTFACLLGAIFLVVTGIGSWRTMVAMALGAFLMATGFEISASLFGMDHGLWNPALYGFPAYKHLILGGLAFGLVFMATDPVSSPAMSKAKWAYGILCGMVTILIRAINPAYPEGVMLAILMGNVFAPLFDYYAAKGYRRRKRGILI